MPTYQYACTACEHRFEAVQSFSDAALTECPECAGRLRKLYGSVGVVFKGSGFYRNDSRSGTKTSTVPAKTDSAPAAKAESSSTSSSASSTSTSTTTSTPAPAAKAS
ncbi:FmdB family zinc ribbon protein [Actinokineospora sp. HUAS TT18]|uniref:FmdB family zinc ribbon protein n=1 Tax=Actinokineospora sp. HUAS TT18 TaxID=3447451 RepID=UPI003F5235CB